MNELLRRVLMLPPQASSFARHIDYLHYTVIGSAFFVCFLAFLLIGYFAIRFRERPGHQARGKIPHWLEVGLAGFTLSAFIV